MTLALLEDTGFYKVNYYSGGIFKFGKNKGGDFLVKNLVENNKATFKEFCVTKDEAQCSSSRSFKSSCYGYQKDEPYEENSSKNYYQNHCKNGTSELPSFYGEKIRSDSFYAL